MMRHPKIRALFSRQDPGTDVGHQDPDQLAMDPPVAGEPTILDRRRREPLA